MTVAELDETAKTLLFIESATVGLQSSKLTTEQLAAATGATEVVALVN